MSALYQDDGANEAATRRDERREDLREDWRGRIVALPRTAKRFILVANDFVLLSFALWAGFSLRLSSFYVPETLAFGFLLLTAPLIGVLVFNHLGLYRLVTRYIGYKGTTRIVLAVLLAVMVWSLVVLLSGVAFEATLPRSSIVMYALFSVALIWVSRQMAGWVLSDMALNLPMNYDPQRRNAIIYGAGQTGVQLAHALRQAGVYNLIGFIDENKTMWGQSVSGLKVYRPTKMSKLVERNGINDVLLALPDANMRRRRTIIKRLEHYPVVVKTLPAMADIVMGRVSISDLRPVDAEDLLGRDQIPPNADLLSRNINGKVVMVSGAGGSIGSELCRQIIAEGPDVLILYERSEVALYESEAELRQLATPETRLVGVLGSVGDRSLIRRTIEHYGVETIYHAAAYKHVPIVEQNPVAGLRNNAFGTFTIATAARDLGVERFVLISTDKAVRPTNVMGASKRIAELTLQALAASGEGKTVFTMVRFGNVLDSSGSVVRLFRRQIASGGPVTVTHPEITRYFMSIPEAAQLVIQAGAMAGGGDVFVLDMGDPVKIDDLARSMIRLMGLQVQDENAPEGDITVEYTGLRPGEKLYEELLIGSNTTGTEHPRIMRNHEPFLAEPVLIQALDQLEEVMLRDDVAAMHGVLGRIVEGYKPESLMRRASDGGPGSVVSSEGSPISPFERTTVSNDASWRGPEDTVH